MRAAREHGQHLAVALEPVLDVLAQPDLVAGQPFGQGRLGLGVALGRVVDGDNGSTWPKSRRTKSAGGYRGVRTRSTAKTAHAYEHARTANGHAYAYYYGNTYADDNSHSANGNANGPTAYGNA